MKHMNLPNKLTMLRILLVPVAAACFLLIPGDVGVMNPASGFGIRNLIVLILFVLASITDYLDGQIARSRHLITSFGKFADPIADKLLVDTLLILLVYDHQASVAAVLLMIARDLIVDGLRMAAAKSGEVVSAGWAGKIKTVLQMAAIIVLLLCDWPFVYLHLPVGQLLLWCSCAASLYSGWLYFEKLKKYVLVSM